MVLRGLDDVSEIVMRAGAGEWACQPGPACPACPGPSPGPGLLAPGIRGLRPGVGDLGSDGCRRPAALQTRALPTNCSSNCSAGRRSGLVQPDCLQCDCRGRGQGGWGRGLPDGAIRDVRDTETGDPGTLMVSQHTALDCFNAEMLIAAPLKMSLFIEYY